MDQRAAIEDTLHMAYEHRAKLPTRGPCSYDHLKAMAQRIRANSHWTEGKLGRWLGWMQCALAVKLSFGDPDQEERYLEHFKRLNAKHAG